MPPTFRVTRDTPAYYLTSVTKYRLPVFRTETLARVACDALNEARKSGRFLIFAYVLMPDHCHVVTDGRIASVDVHRFINGIIGRRIIDYLKKGGFTESLNKLRIQKRSDGSQYSLWAHHPNTRLIWSERMLWQRIQYTHANPMRAGLCEHPKGSRFSSARIWHKRRDESEPLEVDIDSIHWSR